MNLAFLVIWVLVFVSGSIVGIFSDFFVFSWSVEALFIWFVLQILSFKSRWKLWVLLGSAFLWGASHSAPSVTNSIKKSFIAQKNFFPSGSAILVKSEQGYFFASKGGELKQNGEVYAFPQTGWSLSRNGIFKARAPFQAEGLLAKFSLNMDRFFQARLAKVPEDLRAFNASLLLGRTENLGKLKEVFKKLGLIHLLVVSGLHVSFISWAILCLVFAPFQILYGLLILNPRLWFVLKSCLRIVSSVCVFLYAVGIGFPASTQRAVLLFVSDQLTQILGISLSVAKRLMCALALQAFLFPIDFLMVGSFLSWMTYLGIYGLVKGGESLYRILESQVALTLLVAGIIGQLSVIGIVANLLIVPLTPLIFSCAILQLFPDLIGPSLARVVIFFERAFLEWVAHLAIIIEKCDFLYFEFQEIFLLRIVCFTMAVFFLARLWGLFAGVSCWVAKTKIGS